MNNAATTTTKPQKQTAAEAIAENVKALIEQLEQGHSEALTADLTAMGRFHKYSFGNILEIASTVWAARSGDVPCLGRR
jgi:hypothetical protein